MVRLGDYLRGADPSTIDALLQSWSLGRNSFRDAGETLIRSGKEAEDGFSSSSLSGQSARRNMEASGNKTTDKSDVIKEAVSALQDVRATITTAMREHARLEATLPASHGAAPNPSDPKYAQSGTGVDGAQATENQKALQSDRAAYAAREAAIADAERIAAQHVQDIDTSIDKAEPKVRALYDDGSDDSDPVPAGTSSSQNGSHTDIQNAQSRMSKYNSGTLYPDGWGHELIAQEKANIAGYEAENKPEWNGTEWINADGTPAPSTSYAMVETADGLAPLAGGTGGMSALAIAGGGALLGVGVAKAIASRFAAGASAKAATAGATSRSAAARAGATGARAGAGAGARGAGGRGTGAGARGAGGRGAGGRGAGGRGAGAAGGRGAKKRDQNGSQNQEWEADYTDDWTEAASDVLDPNASRGWAPNSMQGDDTSDGKNRRS